MELVPIDGATEAKRRKLIDIKPEELEFKPPIQSDAHYFASYAHIVRISCYLFLIPVLYAAYHLIILL